MYLTASLPVPLGRQTGNVQAGELQEEARQAGDFELAPFNREGGLGKVHQVFGSELNNIIDELNGSLAA